MAAYSSPLPLDPPSEAELLHIHEGRHGRSPAGWGPRQRRRFGYFTPDEYYEAIVDRLVTPGSQWADVGCGRDIFPTNVALAGELVERAAHVTGIDPDPNIFDNKMVHEKWHGIIEDYASDRQFDTITLRMVAEHIANPEETVAKLASMSRPGGRVVVYTPAKYAPISLVAKYTPMSVHHFVKRLVWDVEERDTFPVQYKMNTPAELRALFDRHGFDTALLMYLDDCRATNKFRWLNFIELSVWRALRAVGLRYPECCLLGVFTRRA